MLQSTSNSPMGFNTVKIEPALAGICMACASSDIAGECIEKSPAATMAETVSTATYSARQLPPGSVQRP